VQEALEGGAVKMKRRTVKMMNELFTEKVLRERWDIARGIYGRALDGVVRPTVRGDLDYIEVRIV